MPKTEEILETLTHPEDRESLLRLQQQFGIEPDDPVFILLAVTHNLHALAHQFPERIEAAIARLNEDLEARQGTIDAYGNALEQKYKAVFVDAVKDAVRKLDKGSAPAAVSGFTAGWKAWAAGAALVLLGGAIGGALAWRAAEPITARELVAQLDPSGPRQLTLEEAEALAWAQSAQGQEARRLWELNQGRIEVCQNNKDELGGKCAIVIDPAFVEN